MKPCLSPCGIVNLHRTHGKETSEIIRKYENAKERYNGICRRIGEDKQAEQRSRKVDRENQGDRQMDPEHAGALSREPHRWKLDVTDTLDVLQRTPGLCVAAIVVRRQVIQIAERYARSPEKGNPVFFPGMNSTRPLAGGSPDEAGGERALR